jgi:ribosomal protein S12 methylthiotransferase accessory factor
VEEGAEGGIVSNRRNPNIRREWAMQTELSWIATEADLSVIRLPGTHRAWPPEQSLEMARRAAAKVGVTRIADITRLDAIGIPTYQAIRPTSHTLAVSQGKGVTPVLAKLSAAMEAIEAWHVEQPLAPVRTASMAELGTNLCYDVAALPRSVPTLLHSGLPLEWQPARSLLDGTDTLVPTAVVRLSLEQKRDWSPPAFFESTNGLASGNTVVEATLHALYEVIERDALTGSLRDGRGVRVDPATLGSPVVDDLCGRVERADVAMEVRFVSSPTSLPCFLAWVSSDDYPSAMYGFGCHLNAEIALTRAITEAAQARLAYISGARDDLHDGDDGCPDRRREPTDPAADVADLLPSPVEHDSLLDDLEYVVKQATAAFCYAPLVVDLTREEIGVPVVKVIAPGSRVSPEVL